MELNNIPPGEAAASGVIVAPFLWLLCKKFLTLFQRESVAANMAGAQNDIITQFREEINRLAEVNKALASMVNDLQKENIELKKDISDLHVTIHKMNEQLKMFSLSNRANFSVKIGD